MSAKPSIEVCYSPRDYELFKRDHSIVVVIDVLRATSAICAALDYGVRSIIPVGTVEEAQKYKDDGYITAAERKGQIVEGFPLGNSPFGFMQPKMKNQDIVLTTTNGTKALKMAAKNTEQTIVGSLLNIDTLSAWLYEQQKDILCLCSGWQNKFNLEDSICAGALVDMLTKNISFTSEEDTTIAAKYLFQSAQNNYFGFLKSSSHRRRLRKLNLNEDIKYCLTPNQTEVIPIMKNEKIVKLFP